jgi:hypothetical protein
MAEAARQDGRVEVRLVEQIQVAEDLVMRMVPLEELREQDVNAHVMSRATFDRLAANMKARGASESTLYCARPADDGPYWIISGHHRYRAAVAAGLKAVPALVDLALMTRSTTVAKQLAHNALVGNDDQAILRQLVEEIDNPDDLLTTGLDQSMLPNPGDDKLELFMPRVDFDWMTVTFSALPHQVENLKDLLERLRDRHDLLLTTLPEQFEAFVKAAAEYSRFKEVRSGGTVVAMLTELALREVDEGGESDKDANVTKPMWTRFSTLFGRESIPTPAAGIVEQALARMMSRDEIGPKNKWQAVELWAADYLAGANAE